MAYFSLEPKEFTPQKIKEALRKDEEENPNEETHSLRFDTKREDLHIEEIREDGTLFIICDSELGYISFELKLTDEDIIEIIQLVTKRMNKFKTLLESLK